MRRLYFLVPDVEVGKKVVDELLLAHVEWKHIHVLAKRGTPLEDLPEASAWQKSDIIPAMLRAVPIGGGTGILCGLVALAINPALVVAGGGVLLATSFAGAGVGVYLGGMVGLNVGNTRLKAFEEAIERGELLVIADVARGRVEEITERIKKAHPGAEPEGTEARVPAFP
ncbi:MAG TPA: DUF1269 domain-containing protein [Burkholderiales bacterium]|nr:DUF1269 domain-containing protein [Burkholderiales bacterium]